MTIKTNTNPNEFIAQVIDAWCDRRELKALYCLPPAWISNKGLTDGWETLRAELKYTYATFTNLPPNERDELKRAIDAIDFGLDSRLYQTPTDINLDKQNTG